MTMTLACSRLRVASGCLLLASVLCASPSSADECKPPKPGWSDSQVEGAFDAGVSELESARSATSGAPRMASAKLAEERFRAVEARFPCLPPNVLLLAESLEQQGRYLEAKEQYDRILFSRITLSKTPFWRESVAKAERAAEALAARIPEIIFRQEVGDCAVSSVTVASTRQQPTSQRRVDFDAWFPIDPGEYSVTATSGKCRDFRAVVSVEPGQRREIGVRLSKPPPDTHPPVERGTSTGSSTAKCLGMPSWVCFVGGGVLAAGAITGAVLLLSKPAEATPQPTACADPPATILGCTVLQ